MRSSIDPDETFLYPCVVEIDVRVFLKGRMMDWDNVCVKPYIDAIIGVYIQDDNPNYVRGGSIKVARDSKNPRIEFTITPIGDKEP